MASPAVDRARRPDSSRPAVVERSSATIRGVAFIETVGEDEAAGPVAAMYETDRETFGFVPNFTKAYSARPAVYAAWRQLNGAIKANMDLRRYELATLAAAHRLGSSYCCLAHGSILLDKGFADGDTVRALVADQQRAGLDDVDTAVMDLAAQVAEDPGSVTEADVERLAAAGLTAPPILALVVAAAARRGSHRSRDPRRGARGRGALLLQHDARRAGGRARCEVRRARRGRARRADRGPRDRSELGARGPAARARGDGAPGG